MTLRKFEDVSLINLEFPKRRKKRKKGEALSRGLNCSCLWIFVLFVHIQRYVADSLQFLFSNFSQLLCLTIWLVHFQRLIISESLSTYIRNSKAVAMDISPKKNIYT